MPCCCLLRLIPTTTTASSSSSAASSTDGVHGGAADLVILCPWLPHIGGFAVFLVVTMDRRSLHAAVARRPWHFHLQSGVESDDAAAAAASSGTLMGGVHCRCFKAGSPGLVSVCWGVDVLCRGSQRPQEGCQLSTFLREQWAAAYPTTTRKSLLVVKFL